MEIYMVTKQTKSEKISECYTLIICCYSHHLLFCMVIEGNNAVSELVIKKDVHGGIIKECHSVISESWTKKMTPIQSNLITKTPKDVFVLPKGQLLWITMYKNHRMKNSMKGVDRLTALSSSYIIWLLGQFKSKHKLNVVVNKLSKIINFKHFKL